MFQIYTIIVIHVIMEITEKYVNVYRKCNNK